MSGIIDMGPEAPPTYVLRGGVPEARLAEVRPGFLSALDSKPPRIRRPPRLSSTSRRTPLANWLASADHPLTAGVMVNRIWLYDFGQGVVATPSDFMAGFRVCVEQLEH